MKPISPRNEAFQWPFEASFQAQGDLADLDSLQERLSELEKEGREKERELDLANTKKASVAYPILRLFCIYLNIYLALFRFSLSEFMPIYAYICFEELERVHMIAGETYAEMELESYRQSQGNLRLETEMKMNDLESLIMESKQNAKDLQLMLQQAALKDIEIGH